MCDWCGGRSDGCWDLQDVVQSEDKELLAGVTGLMGGEMVLCDGQMSGGKMQVYLLKTLAQLRALDPSRVWPLKFSDSQLFLQWDPELRSASWLEPIVCCTRVAAAVFGVAEYRVLESAFAADINEQLSIRRLQFRYGESSEISMFIPRQLHSSIADDLHCAIKEFKAAIGKRGPRTTGEVKRHISSFRAFPKSVLLTALRQGKITFNSKRGKRSVVIKTPWEELTGEQLVHRGSYKASGRGFSLGEERELVLDCATSRLAIRSLAAMPDGNLIKRTKKRKKQCPRTKLNKTKEPTAENYDEHVLRPPPPAKKIRKNSIRPPRTELGVLA